MEKLAYVGLVSLIVVSFFIPFRTWVENRRISQRLRFWQDWLIARPNLQEYLKIHHQNIDQLSCYYCGEVRLHHSLEMVTVANFKRGFFQNKTAGYSYWRSCSCSKCQTELFREVEEKPV